jgi:hypothetical protein
MSEREPWLDEPDLDSFYVGEYLCVALRESMAGHWCGYVGVGAKNPLYELPRAALEEEIVCHGDLNFAGRLVQFTGWFFGFDCGHGLDYSPRYADSLARAGAPPGLVDVVRKLFDGERDSPFPRVYRDLNYVRANLVAVAAQLMDFCEDAETAERLAIERARLYTTRKDGH